MYEPRNQRRTLTKRLLKESLIELLKEKDIRKINITELCRAAGVNRTTFYCHYSNQYDVLKDMENTMLRELQAIIDRYRSDDRAKLPEMMEAICDFLKENPEISKAVLENNGIESEFASALFRTPAARRFAAAHLPAHYDETDRELLMLCFSKGGYSLIRQWLVYDLPKSSKEIAGLICEITTKGRTASPSGTPD